MGCSEDGFVVVVASNTHLELKYIDYQFMFQGPYWDGKESYRYTLIRIEFHD